MKKNIKMDVKSMNIKIYPAPVLLKKATPVKEITDEIRKTLDEMLELMYEINGVGLAAPQVGISKRMLVIDTARVDEGETKRPIKMINPKITKLSKEECECEEGCLSLPEIYREVKRPCEVTVEYTDENGKPQKLTADELLGRAIQHEIDHLNGVVFIDHLSALKKKMAVSRLEKIIKKYLES